MQMKTTFGLYNAYDTEEECKSAAREEDIRS